MVQAHCCRGLGQVVTIGSVSGEHWSMSGMYDRTRHPAQGLHGGKPGAVGEYLTSEGERPSPKRQHRFDPHTRATVELPGGGGYFDPYARAPEQVLEDVIVGYVSPEAAEREYGVKVTCTKRSEERISLPEHYAIDWDATRRLRGPAPRP